MDIRVACLLAICLLTGCDSGPRVDYSKNSSNILQHLTYDETYPFVGFWKLQRNDNFGMAIDKHGDGQYSVWFCGPGGSGEIEMLSPTKLTGDSNFKIIDENTIEAIDKNGLFNTYTQNQAVTRRIGTASTLHFQLTSQSAVTAAVSRQNCN